MRKIFLSAALLTALLLTAGCKESDNPTGTPRAVTIEQQINDLAPFDTVVVRNIVSGTAAVANRYYSQSTGNAAEELADLYALDGFIVIKTNDEMTVSRPIARLHDWTFDAMTGTLTLTFSE